MRLGSSPPQREVLRMPMNSQHDDLPSNETRRSFIKKTATAAAAISTAGIIKTPVYGQSTAPSTGRVIGANDRIAVGYIGVGSQGMAHVRFQKENASNNNIVQAAVCDVYQKRLDVARQTTGVEEKNAYRDYRKLLER